MVFTCVWQAALPRSAVHGSSPAAVLGHMAADATRAATESPFLDGQLLAADSLLCCIGIPPEHGLAAGESHFLGRPFCRAASSMRQL